MPLPRSNFTGRLREFAEFVSSDDAAFNRHGRWGEFFGQRIGPKFDGRVIVEIGCADVTLLHAIAVKNPACGFVGIDWKCKPLLDGAQRISAEGLANIALLRARGQDISRLFADGEVDEVWIFHPEPLDGEKELKNRLVVETFLRDVHHVLRRGPSMLALKTDHRGYYERVMGLFSIPRGNAPSDAIQRYFEITMNSADYWNDPAALARTAARAFAGQVTAYENRFIKKRKPIYYLELRPTSGGRT